MSRHAVIKLKLRAKIGDFEFKDVVQYTSAWALNSIPSAAIQVAVGKNVQDQELAKIHDAARSLTTRLKAEVFLAMTVPAASRRSSRRSQLPT